jgi:hypothetical protein
MGSNSTGRDDALGRQSQFLVLTLEHGGDVGHPLTLVVHHPDLDIERPTNGARLVGNIAQLPAQGDWVGR